MTKKEKNQLIDVLIKKPKDKENKNRRELIIIEDKLWVKQTKTGDFAIYDDRKEQDAYYIYDENRKLKKTIL